MMEPNDWKKLSEELEGIKRDEYHRGYEKAVEDFGDAKKKQDEDRRKFDEQVQSWHSILNNLRQAWAKEIGKQAQWMDTEKDKHRYQLMFGHKTDYFAGHYVNMPEDMDEFIHALAESLKMAADFKMLIAEFEKNALVKAQWDRLLVAMRMTNE